MKNWLLSLLALALPGLDAQSFYWSPAPNTSWQWQLSGTVDQTANVAMYDIDLFGNTASVVASLHAQGRRVVCYVSAGSWEDFRPDAGRFPDSVKGSTLSGYPDERWLDIRNIDVLGPIMLARLDLCKSKGFDAVEPDNVDGYANHTGFPLTYADQIRYNTWLASAAHARGLSVALKNDLDQVRDLQPLFDWALNEQCFEYQECDSLMPFVNAGKAVFNVEYNLTTAQFCPQANNLGFNSIRKGVDLDAYREPCRDGSAKSIVIFANAIVNAASRRANSVAPGEVVTIYGSGLGPAAAGSFMLNASGLIDTSLAGVRVWFDGVAAPLIYVQSGQLNVSVPYEVSGKSSTQVQVEFIGIRSDPTTLQVSETSPGIFTIDPGGSGQGVILNEDGNLNSAFNPATAGSVVVIFATGEGQTSPAGVNGKLASDVVPKPQAQISVQMGGLNSDVLDAGGVPGEIAGILQVSVRVPSDVTPGASVPIQLTVGTVVTQPGVTLAIK